MAENNKSKTKKLTPAFTPEQTAAIRVAAGRAGLSPTTWVHRQACQGAAVSPTAHRPYFCDSAKAKAAGDKGRETMAQEAIIQKALDE